ncbi:VanZ family protein [Sporolactobacillus kofuensis]|uniref:VanZ family protein n=1 Tax=Sporolactobacillus kofuensis TaxID=269672 RepID=A0ABW1WK86_9BACL|nr:VanZ family protein [Sporolactobacillus kofuensis]MCO7176905.1 VanZ family protein [Sporolactobacillus kofuensis]
MSHVLNPTIFEFFLTYSVFLSVSLLWERYVRKTLTYHRGVFLSLLVGYLLITLLLAVQPMSRVEQSLISPGGPFVNLQPFRDIMLQTQSDQGHWLLMWNSLLPVPFIFFVGFASHGNLRLSGLIVIGMTAILVVECGLYFMNNVPHFPKHLFDIDALILNSIGVLTGSILFFCMQKTQWMQECISETMSTR